MPPSSRRRRGDNFYVRPQIRINVLDEIAFLLDGKFPNLRTYEAATVPLMASAQAYTLSVQTELLLKMCALRKLHKLKAQFL
jgi:hypothetical protein